MNVWKYNLWKGLSTLATVGTPIIVLATQYSLYYHRSETAISASGLFAILIALLFFKDKIAENWKMPSPLVLSIIVFVMIILIEHIIEPVKIVCIATMITCGADELFFKRFYKREELKFTTHGVNLDLYKHFGFLFVTTETLNGGNNEQDKQGD